MQHWQGRCCVGTLGVKHGHEWDDYQFVVSRFVLCCGAGEASVGL